MNDILVHKYNKYRSQYLDLKYGQTLNQSGAHSNTNTNQSLLISPAFIQNGGKVLKHKNGHRYGGAGIFLIENMYTKGNKPYESAVILFKNKRSKEYEDIGGSCNPEDDMKQDGTVDLTKTAMRESREESAGYIFFKSQGELNRKISKMDQFVDGLHKISKSYYRGFFVGIKEGQFNGQKFMDNLKIMKDENYHKTWKEMEDVQRFYISDLIKYGILHKQKDVQCPDGKGEMRKISNRARIIIRMAIESGLIFHARDNPKKFIAKKTALPDLSKGIHSIVNQ